MSATLYICCNFGCYFKAQRECPYDGWSSPEAEELAAAAAALETARVAPSIAVLRERGVGEPALRRAVVMDFGDDSRGFDLMMPSFFVVAGQETHRPRGDEQRAASLAGPLAAFEQMLRERAATGDVTIVRKALPGIPRLELKRAVGRGAMRYIELHAVEDPTVPWRFAFLFGEYGGANDTDGRRGGDLAYVRAFIEAWLVELRPASALPAPTA